MKQRLDDAVQLNEQIVERMEKYCTQLLAAGMKEPGRRLSEGILPACGHGIRNKVHTTRPADHKSESAGRCVWGATLVEGRCDIRSKSCAAKEEIDNCGTVCYYGYGDTKVR